MDPISFQKDLRVTIQALGWEKDGSPNYRKLADDVTSVAYWYQNGPDTPFPPLHTLADRTTKVLPPD